MKLAEKGFAFIEHFGVKGMRWGVRRSEAQLARDSGKKDGEGDGEEASGASRNSHQSSRPRSPAGLTDSQLQAAVNRMNLEQQYARLQPTPASQQAANFIASAAVNVARTQLQNQANQQINAQLRKMIRARAAARAAGG